MVNEALSKEMRQIATRRRYPLRTLTPGPDLHTHIHDRADLDEANALIGLFGSQAAHEAAARADRSRNLGNIIHFCRWRMIERMILMLGDREVTGTVQ